MLIRTPKVSGSFYPSNPQSIREEISNLLALEQEKQVMSLDTNHIIGGIIPHAGYRYSGLEAVQFFRLAGLYAKKVDTFVIIHPDHYGSGISVSTDPHDAWRSPFGNVNIDVEMRDLLDLPRATGMNDREHAAEVLVPFLQYFIPYEFEILPVSMLEQNMKNAQALGRALTEVTKQLNRRIMLLASSDFSHYVQPEEGHYLDGLVIDRIAAFDPEGLYETIIDNNISVCGYGPIMSLLFYAQMVAEIPKVKILARGNSGKISGSGQVVDYVSAIFFE